MQQMYQCPKCGGQIAFGTLSCPKCGQSFSWPVQPQAQPPHQQKPPKQPMSNMVKGILGSLVIFLVIVGSCAMCLSGDSGTTSSSGTVVPETTPPPKQKPPSPPPTFNPIILKGADSKTTAPFIITTDEWIIDWSYSTSDPDFAIFSFFVYPRGETELYVETVLFPEATSGTTYSYAGPGEYYVEINVANITQWEITISPTE